MAGAASRLLLNNGKSSLQFIRGSLLSRAGANLVRDQKMLLAPASALDHVGFPEFLSIAESDRPQASGKAADLFVGRRFGVSDQEEMNLRRAKEFSEDEDDDDDEIPFDIEDMDEEDFDSDDFSDEVETDDDMDTPKKRK